MSTRKHSTAPSALSGIPSANDAVPICLVVGMAGSGKTTLVNALACYLDDHSLPQLACAERLVHAPCSPQTLDVDKQVESSGLVCLEVQKQSLQPEVSSEATTDDAQGDSNNSPAGAYVINLDPAVAELPYESNIDIRDTVKYKEVMREYSLGPNGAIITSLNLFATRFDQVLALIEKRAHESRAILVDTPGQIETFTWSASGAIITESLSVTLPTVVLFVVDTPRSESAMTFVSNMLYACSIMYKTRLPLVVVFNKIDVVCSSLATAWMRDFDAFDAALKEDTFASTLARSMAQALEEFYKVMKCVSVSAATEDGMQDLLVAIREATCEYMRDYRPQLERKMAHRAEEDQIRKREQLQKLQADLEAEKNGPFGSESVDDCGTANRAGNSVNLSRTRSASDWPGTGSEVGKGSRQIHALKRAINTGGRFDPNDPVDAMNDDGEDAQAYVDFVKYLEALRTNDGAENESSQK